MTILTKTMWVTSDGEAFEDKFVAAKHEARSALDAIIDPIATETHLSKKFDEAIEAILANPKDVTAALVEYVEQYNLPRPAAQCPPVQPNPISPNHPDWVPTDD